jgi:hypothetical protein
LSNKPKQKASERSSGARKLIRERSILKMQVNTVRFLREAIDFGYANVTLVKAAINMMGLILFTETDQFGENYKSPFFDFIRQARKSRDLYPICKTLIKEAIKCLQVISKVRQNLQTFILLKFYPKMGSFEKEIGKLIHEIFEVFSLSLPKSQELVSLENYAEFITDCKAFEVESAVSPVREGNNGMGYIEGIRFELETLRGTTYPIDMILLSLIFSRKSHSVDNESLDPSEDKTDLDVEHIGGLLNILDMDQEIKDSMLEVVLGFFSQRQEILSKLLGIELIHGLDEKSIYSFFNDHKQRGKEKEINPINIMNLTEMVSVVLRIDPRYHSLDPTEDKKLKELYQDQIVGVEASLRIMIKDMASKYEEKMNLKKTQNILRNKEYHVQVFRLFNIIYNPEVHKSLFETAIEFFYYFTLYNSVNKKLLFPKLTILIGLISHGIKTTKLISSVGQALEKYKDMSDLIEDIFKRINHLISTNEMNLVLNLRTTFKMNKSSIFTNELFLKLEILTEYKKVLSALTMDEKGHKRLEIQRKIIFCLINNKELVKIYEFKYYNELKSLLTNPKFSKAEIMPLYLFYVAFLTLLAELSWDFKMGIDQAKRLITKEQILDLLTSNSTPFFFKKHFLKCFHYVLLV